MVKPAWDLSTWISSKRLFGRFPDVWLGAVHKNRKFLEHYLSQSAWVWTRFFWSWKRCSKTTQVLVKSCKQPSPTLTPHFPALHRAPCLAKFPCRLRKCQVQNQGSFSDIRSGCQTHEILLYLVPRSTVRLLFSQLIKKFSFVPVVATKWRAEHTTVKSATHQKTYIICHIYIYIHFYILTHQQFGDKVLKSIIDCYTTSSLCALTST